MSDLLLKYQELILVGAIGFAIYVLLFVP